ncbi:MAG: hypothetical protein NVS9B3_16200 [Gemmatimonadaceae bacterium]
MRIHYRVLFAGVPAAFSLLACKDTPGRPVRVSVASTPAAATLPSRSIGLSPDVVVSGSNGSIKVTKAEIVLAEIELKPVSATGGCKTVGKDECDEIEIAPMLVDLPLTQGSVSGQFTATVPVGHYRAFEAEVDAMTDGKTGATAFFSKYPSWPKGTSVRVSGQYTPAGGTPTSFTYLSAVDAEIESEFTTPITVDANGIANITVNVDVGSWFQSSSSGPVLDPSNAANAAAIDSNIKKSLRAFEDDDMRGVESKR